MAVFLKKEVATSASQEVGFMFIKIQKDEVLGSGSYGTVYKANCDNLVCAAKVLHHIGVDQGSKNGHFEKEYEFLTSLRHPNIVLFLGITRDEDTNFPMLLMELMDESLTMLLESVLEPLPFHFAVNICHDVALALSFLHSNGIIHGKLSSNNVLMIGNVRAKVSDFGLFKLWNTNINEDPLAKQPSCSVYMPPESAATHSNKLDCFSFGVLSIQILTNYYPQPSDVTNPRVSERERRKGHLDLIFSDHPILPLALDCIQDKEVNRPLSSAICSQLFHIKKSSQYLETILKTSTKDTVLEDIDKLVLEMQYFSVPSQEASVSDPSTSHNNKVEHAEFQNMEEQPSGLEETGASDEIKRLKEELELLHDQMQKREVVSPVHETTAATSGKEESGLHTLTLDIDVEDSKSTSTESQQMSQEAEALATGTQSQSEPLQTSSPCKTPEQENEQYTAYREEIFHMTAELEKASRLLKEKDQLLQASEQQYRELRQEMGVLEKKFSMGETVNSPPLSTVTLKWTKEIKASLPVSRSTEAIISSGSVIFICPGGTKKVHAYNIDTGSWSKFPDVPNNDCTLTLIKRNLSVIGGKIGTNQFTNKVMSLISSEGKRKWVEIYPRMEVKRSNVVTVQCPTILVVAGGENELGYIPTVEVLDTTRSTNSLAWTRVADLPEPLAMASATLCGDNVCILGGWVEKMSPSYAAYSVPIASLSRSRSTDTSWKTLANLPTKGSSSVSVKGRLLAVGGRNSHQPSTAVHIYNPESESWEVLSNMLHPRHQCFATVVNTKLVVLGGWVLNKKQLLTEIRTIEIADIL